jgi:hypothetical protein
VKIIRPVTITDALLVSSSVAEDDYTAYNTGTTYGLGDHAISTSTHRIYESLQASNTNNPLPVSPETTTAWWRDIGATNRWKMFDGGVSMQTEDSDEITVVLTPGRVDSIALLNISAQSYRVMMAADASSPSDIELVVGAFRNLGEMQWAPRVGIVDYSVKSTDEFGNATVVERAFSKRMTADVFVENVSIDETIRILAQYRATAVVWVGSDEFTSMLIYGYFRSFDAVIQSPGGSFCNLEIEGLV